MILHDRLAFSPEEYVRRYDVIQKGMEKLGLDAVLARGPENPHLCRRLQTPGLLYKYHCVIVPKNGEPVFLVRNWSGSTPEFAWSTKIVKVYDSDHPPSVTTNILQQLGLGSGRAHGR